MMKKIICAVLLCCCVAVVSAQRKINVDKLAKDQIKITDQRQGLPGKCYTKMKTPEGELGWFEVICAGEHKYTKVVQEGLMKLGYIIDESEIKKHDFGETTKHAIIQFQQDQKMAYGGLDEATIRRILTLASH